MTVRVRVRDILDDPRVAPFYDMPDAAMVVDIVTDDGREYAINIGRIDPNAIVIRTAESSGLLMSAEAGNVVAIRSIRPSERDRIQR